MIVVDTSALVAIVLAEPDAVQFASVMRDHEVSVSSASVFEAAMVLESRQGPSATQDLKALLTTFRATVVEVGEDIAWVAHAAWCRFGKGRHPAGLNYGDCFSYALAKSLDAPLLYKGNDFSQTDVKSAG